MMITMKMMLMIWIITAGQKSISQACQKEGENNEDDSNDNDKSTSKRGKKPKPSNDKRNRITVHTKASSSFIMDKGKKNISYDRTQKV